MLWNTAIDSTARGHALAGFSFLMIAISAAVQGADVASLPTHPLRGIDGRRIDLMAPPHGAMTIIFYSTECPISNSYSPTLATLVDSFEGKPAKWLGVCVDPDLSDSDVTAHAQLRPEVSGGSRPPWVACSEAGSPENSRSIRDRRPRQDPLSRAN